MWKLSLKGASFLYQIVAVVVLFSDSVWWAGPRLSTSPRVTTEENYFPHFTRELPSSDQAKTQQRPDWIREMIGLVFKQRKTLAMLYLINIKFRESPNYHENTE